MYCPVGMSVGIDPFFHVIAFFRTASLSNPFPVKAIVRRFTVEENCIVFTCIALLRASARMIMPDNLIFEARSVCARVEAKNFIQYNSGIMGNAPVQMYVKASIGRKKKF